MALEPLRYLAVHLRGDLVVSAAAVLCVGHAVQDFVFNVPDIPTTPAKHRATAFSSMGGGPAATAAVCIARLGGTALLAARVGNDAIADLIEAELVGYGVDCTHLSRITGCGSSLSAVFVDKRGERLIVNHLDPNLPTSTDWLPSPAALGCRAVLADTRWPAGALAALGAARDSGLPAVLDADQPIPSDGRLLAAATHVAFSQDALADYTGESDPVQGLRAAGLSNWCCVTVGVHGVHVLENGVHQHIAGHRVPVIDTLGAGDVWHGAFALALAEGQPELAAVRFASAAAALKVQRAGGRRGTPDRSELNQFLTTVSG
jgi:sulfofructose kinase